MWVGLLYEKPEDGAEDVAFALFYEPHRIFVAGGPVAGDGLATTTWAWRQAAAEVGGIAAPYCPHCEAPLEVPCV